MKLLGLLSVGFLQLPLEVLAMRASLGLKETLLAASRERSVSFASLPFDLPNNTLISQDALTNNDQYSDVLGPDGRVGCTESFSSESSEEIAVVLAFSKCLDDSSLSIVEEWVNQVKTGITTTPYAEDLKITFQSTMVPGACEERSEKTKQGLADPTMENQGGATPSKNPETTQSPSKGPETSQPPGLLADGVLLTDLKRLEAFPGLGSVVNLADDSITVAEKPIAVISFVTGEKSYGEVVQYEASVQVSKTFNFHICKSGTNCEGTFENCIDLPEVVDLFMYNPFTVTRSIECANLDGGVPVTYLDDYGARQCFCNCPAGHVLEENDYGGLACKQVDDEICACVWAQVNEFKVEVDNDKETCSFKGFATDSVLSVPFPTDGYVADKRDTLKEGYQNPRITVTADREQFAEYKGSDIQSVVGAGVSLPLTFDEVVGHSSSASNLKPLVAPTYGTKTYTAEYPWKEYQVNRVAHIDDLEFTSYGKYKLEVSAYDYFSGATCEGCLVIVDKYRPKATTECPSSFCDDVADPVHCTESAELTTSNLKKANGLVNQYFDFAKKAKNDACSVDNRCDKESFSRRDFFEKDYTDHDCSQAHQCFDKDKILEDLLASAKTKTNPLKKEDNGCDNTAAPVPIGQCTRCCKMETALREWWTDYRCGSDYDVRSCEGDRDQTCQFSQCLVMNGDTLATVTASITADAKAESESVLAQVEDEAYQTVTQIHRSLDCTSFGGTDGECEFRAKLSELIDTTETLRVASTYSSGQATDYVFWRYKLVSDGESWQLWKTGKQENYGEVTYDNDDVLTFSNPETKITLEAWTQCGLVRRFFFYVHLHVNSPVSVCEKFNDMWYQTSVSRLPIGSGMCAYPGSDFAELTFDFHPNAGLQYSREELRMKVSKVECTGALEGRLPIDILNVTHDSPEIVTRFAVEMLNKATTEAATDFHVECTFTYTKRSGTKAEETCKRDFSITDCKGPAFDTPDSECEYEACAGQEEVGLYEACGGTVVKADETCTIVETGEKPCCQGCENTEVTCVALLDLPNSNADIMRCEPSSGGAYSSYSNYAAVLLTETAQDHPAAMTLLGATALIAVVALVGVRRRAVASHSAQMADDAYYPLLH
ncbi:hypothetical protein PC116_g1020 [Phytophthora cactorum]|uniref:Immunoglobulin-like fold n=2 Tax=Phytophthora cactorum TaxID=29920 RepID=A0A329SH24_9STRA|nr:hypothetical protein Pcac1_g3023 [Phytophthora cactorum]KAG2864413.1 hypothetical protein PC113_g4592 [Phytophthora cactorum]KAG2937760.1 hypothetical protein PC115_g4069 [Phytophthora cactorum]KAG2953857.1 hypothetical protein PC117_g1698 [Phytophthora cactorum]KAG2993323.1 hypothetical protein PC118_g4075 [Phytophthora cactorum]